MSRLVRPGGRVWLALYVALAGLTCAATVVHFVLLVAPRQRAMAVARWEASLTALAADRSALISGLVEEAVVRGGELATLAELPGARTDGPSGADPASLVGQLTQYGRRRAVLATYVLDAELATVAASAGAPPGATLLAPAILAENRTAGPSVELRPLLNGDPAVVITLPVRTGAGVSARRLVLVYDARRWIFPLLEPPPLAAHSLESVLVEVRGESIAFLSPLAHGSGPLPGTHPPQSAEGIAAASARRPFGGALDYRGREVLATGRAVPGTPWDVVVKVDRDEAMRDASRAIREGAISRAAMFLLILLGGLVAWRGQRTQWARGLEASATRFRQLLDQANDAVLLLDGSGQIRAVNRRAERLYGRSREELVGQPVGMLAEDGGAAFAAGAERASSDRGLLFEARHRSRDGAALDVEASARFIELDGETLLLATVRDIAERKRAERERAMLAHAIRSSGEDVLILDLDGTVRFVNEAFLRTNHLSFESEILGRHASVLNSPRNPPGLQEAINDARRVGGWRGEMWVTRRDGTEFIIGMSTSAVLDDTGQPIALVAIGRDMTEQRLAEAALQESERRLRAILSTVRLAAVTLDTDGRVSFCNDYLAETTGWSREQLEGCDWFERCIPEELRATLRAGFQEALAAGRIFTPHTDELVCRSGERRRVTWHNIVLHDLEGRAAGTASIGEDVTERHRAEEALIASEERFRTLLESSGEGIGIVDLAVRFAFANPRAEAIFGVAPGALVGRDLREFIAPDDLGVLEAQRERRREGARGAYEVGLVTGRGEPRRLAITATPLRGAGGRIVGSNCVFRDVTEKRALEDALREAQRMETVGRLAGGVAQDLNNLLQSMLTLTQALSSGRGDAVKETSQALEAHVRHGASLARQLLLFAQRHATKLERTDLNRLVLGAERLLERLVPATVERALDLTPDLPAVCADAGQIEQVLVNLVTNAVDAMPAGGRLTVRTVATDEGGAAIEVQDSGTGVPLELRQRIFEPFFSTKGEAGASGLGLSVVHGIARSHGGRIELEGRSGGGSTFRFALPRAACTSSQEAEARAERPLPRIGRVRVLVVDDEPAAREGLAEALAALGYEVGTAASGEEAGLLPGDPPFDVLLTDFRLPGCTGADLARGLRDRWPGLRVVLMSGYTSDELVRADVSSGAVRFLQKPFDLDALERELAGVLGSRGE